MTSVIATTEQKDQIIAVQKNVREMSAVAGGVKIKTAKDLENALVIFKQIGELKKEYKRVVEDGIVKPIKDGLKALTAFVSPVKEMLDDSEAWVRGQIGEYNDKVKADAAVIAATETAKIEAGETTVKKAAAKVERVEAKVEAIPTRKQKVVTITDPALVPDNFWIIDEVLVRKQALAGVVIPGVLVEEKEVIVNR